MSLSSTERSRLRRARMTPQERTAYQMKYANKRRLDLIKILSPDGCCAACRECVGHEALEVNHVDGITWDHNVLAPHRRHAASMGNNYQRRRLGSGQFEPGERNAWKSVLY